MLVIICYLLSQALLIHVYLRELKTYVHTKLYALTSVVPLFHTFMAMQNYGGALGKWGTDTKFPVVDTKFLSRVVKILKWIVIMVV